MDKLDKSLDEIMQEKNGPARGEAGRYQRKSSPYDRPRGGGRRRGGGRGGMYRSGGGSGSSRVYVGNLNWNVSWQDLKDHMRQSGNVLHVDILEFPDGKSKGCAIVEYDNKRASEKAIAELTDTELNGRKIFVREDREAGNAGGFQPQQFQQQGGYQQQYQVADQPAYKSGSFAAQKIRNSTPAENQVYIGNLPWSVKWQDLKDLCAKHGEVIRADVQENADGRSKGFGTVVFANAQEAACCIDELNESELENRKLIVRLDTRAAAAKVYVGNLPWSASWQDLKDIAKQFGDVQHADIITEPSGRSKGFGIVTFADAAGAEQCIAGLNGQEFQGRTLQVKVDERP